MISLAFAQSDIAVTREGVELDTDEVKITTTSETPIRDAAKRILQNTNSVEDCVEKISKNYPKVDSDKIEDVCNNLMMTKETYEEKNIFKEEIKERIKDEELRVRIQTNMDESQKYKLIKFLEGHPELEKMIKNLSDEEIEKLGNFDREKIKRISQSENVKEELSKYQFKNVSKEDIYRKRVVAENKFKESKEKFEKATKRFEKATNNFLEAKEKFEKALEEGDDENAIIYAKEYLGNGIEMIISSLEKVKENAQSNDDLTEEEVEDIVSNADEKIVEAQELATKLEAATTKEEIKEIAKTMSDEWNKTKAHIAYGAAKAFDSKVGEILSRSNQLEAKFERTLSRLEEDGYDISQLDELVNDFNIKLNNAEEYYDIGKEKIVEARNLRLNENLSEEEFESLIEEGKENIKKAHEELESAQEIIKEIVKETKKLNPNTSFEDENKQYQVIEEIDSSSVEELENEEETEIENDMSNEEINETENNILDEEETEIEVETEEISVNGNDTELSVETDNVNISISENGINIETEDLNILIGE
jgi:hypothetical protein